MEPKIKHLMYVPFTGLGLYQGFRGNRWLKNRIAIFKQFVVPSLKHQSSQNFIIWISWRREEKNNPYVKQFIKDLNAEFGEAKVVHTFAGVCFYDDKYSDEQARERLINALHLSFAPLLDAVGECDEILMTIQPSDDLYHYKTVEFIQKLLESPLYDAAGFKAGYICNYNTKEISEYNPNTNPPFYTIKFPKNIFFDPLLHSQFTALKRDSGKYKVGTPLPSHEYVPDCFKYAIISDLRGFLVGTHGENISTTYVHPFKGLQVQKDILKDFGIYDVPELKIKFSLRKRILRLLPHFWQRKLRYIFGEKLLNMCYNFLRS